jgi:hypothetical protein
MNPLETYLRELREIRSTGAAVRETSYYPPLAQLLNEVGKTLKPKVRCVSILKNQGAGMPDGGLFTADQFQRSTGDPLEGQMPARGCIEVKSTGEEIVDIAGSQQVQKYLNKYRQVLVTNYRDFALVGYDQSGNTTTLEAYRLAADEDEFWRATPHRMAAEQGERFVEYLKRVMLHAAPLVSPETVAWFLASYARDAKARIEGVDLPALANLRKALEEALGLRFVGEQGEHFFRSTLVQTLFYGVFSAWVLWSKQHSPTDKSARFDWRTAAYTLRVPMISALFYQVASPANLGPLGLVEVMDWTAAVLNRVEREQFFDKFEESHAVQYFYEPFLQNFDPELRRQLGVWYTPTEIVRYMVARVDTVLREELGIADGLADERVYVLDPCCGTGAYLVEVLRRIEETLGERGGDALGADDLKRAAMNRIYGFEILPAPFVVAHLQLGLLLQNLGAPLSETKDERVGVYLTNALTGWEPPKEPKTHLLFPELEEERDRAEQVKRETPILVILGNPPYNAFAGTSPAEEQGLVEPYKEGLQKEWGIKKFNLDDLYVRFFRLAERRIAEKTGQGVVCFISNHSWISDPSFVVLRQHLLESFDKFWIENMHGNRKISEYAPDGRTSETIFAIPGFSAGIQQGVAVSLWVKTGNEGIKKQVLFRDDLNAAKAVERRAQLLASLKAESFDAQYTTARPDRNNRFSFRVADVPIHYRSWPTVAALSAREPFNGPIERRGNSLVVFEDEQKKLALLEDYLNPQKSDDEIGAIAPRFMKSSGEFKAERTRNLLKGKVKYDPSKVVKYPFKPFDIRLAYLDAAIQPLFSRPSPDLLKQRFTGNKFLIVRESSVTKPNSSPFYFSSLICDYHSLSVEAKHIPLRLINDFSDRDKDNNGQGTLLERAATIITANLSPDARAYLASLGISDPDADADTAALVWMHALAIGYAPAYLDENADGIRNDWPRVPLPAERDALIHSAALGRRVALLLDTEQAVPTVTTGSLDALSRTVAVVSRAGGGTLQQEKGELKVTAGWGHAGKGGVTMPGKGKLITRDYTATERAAIEEAAARLHLSDAEIYAHLGETTCDVYLNDVAFWRNVPSRVWDYTIGGYQVMKKWLSYREFELLKRPLSADEAREVTNMARRLCALLLLEPALDDNYRAIKAAAYPWPTAAAPIA